MPLITSGRVSGSGRCSSGIGSGGSASKGLRPKSFAGSCSSKPGPGSGRQAVGLRAGARCTGRSPCSSRGPAPPGSGPSGGRSRSPSRCSGARRIRCSVRSPCSTPAGETAWASRRLWACLGPRSALKGCKLLARAQVPSIVGIRPDGGLGERKACADPRGGRNLFRSKRLQSVVSSSTCGASRGAKRGARARALVRDSAFVTIPGPRPRLVALKVREGTTRPAFSKSSRSSDRLGWAAGWAATPHRV